MNCDHHQCPHLLPDTFYTLPLDAWAAAIQRVPSEAEQCLVEQVVHYKALSDMEHEFLVVHACHPSGSKVVLGVDRNADIFTAAQQHTPTAALGSSSSLASSARCISTLMRFFPPPPSPAEARQPAYNSAQVSHDATPTPFLAQQGPSVSLSVDRNTDILIAAQKHAPTERASAAGPSSFLGSSARYIDNMFTRLRPPLPSPSEVRQPAYDRVQVSHDATPAPILAQHGPSVPLSTVSFSLAPAATGRPTWCPTLLHLSVLLLTIRAQFPSYALLQYQCYFFARAACLALADIFGGATVQHEEGHRAATWRGVHVSMYSAGRTALQRIVFIPRDLFTVLIVPVAFFAAYSVVKLYDGNVVESDVDRRRIFDEKIREHAIPRKYHAAWHTFVHDTSNSTVTKWR